MILTPKDLPKLSQNKTEFKPNFLNEISSFVLSDGILYSNRPQIIWDEQIIIDDFYSGREFKWKSNYTGQEIDINNIVLFGRYLERVEISYNGNRECASFRIDPNKIDKELFNVE